MASPPPTRFLVQHCLQTEARGPVIYEIAATSFEHVANTVLTNNGAFSPIHIAGLSLEAYQPDFDDWIAARTIGDLLASRKLRVMSLDSAPPPQAQPVPAPSFPPPSAPPGQPPAEAPSTPTSITIEIKDILLAIGSLPRTTEPSCSSVLEHLARQRLPSLGAMVESGLRECGHQPVWGAPLATNRVPSIDQAHSSVKRPREDQQQHVTDNAHELAQRRMRPDTASTLGTLTRWEGAPPSGFIQPIGTADRAVSAFVHIRENPGLAGAKVGDWIRYVAIPNPLKPGFLKATNAHQDNPPATSTGWEQATGAHHQTGGLETAPRVKDDTNRQPTKCDHCNQPVPKSEGFPAHNQKCEARKKALQENRKSGRPY